MEAVRSPIFLLKWRFWVTSQKERKKLHRARERLNSLKCRPLNGAGHYLTLNSEGRRDSRPWASQKTWHHSLPH